MENPFDMDEQQESLPGIYQRFERVLRENTKTTPKKEPFA
jgi:hypothetical protein